MAARAAAHGVTRGRVLAMTEARKSPPEIAAELGVEPCAVRRHRRIAGIKAYWPPNPPPKPDTLSHRILELALTGDMSNGEIARAVGRPDRHVSAIMCQLRKRGLVKRDTFPPRARPVKPRDASPVEPPPEKPISLPVRQQVVASDAPSPDGHSSLDSAAGDEPAAAFSGWTKDLTAELAALWNAGRSANECAAALGRGITRNQVIGKVHRLGIEGRPVEGVALLNLGDRHCRWPMWPHHERPNGLYCGAPRLIDCVGSYCRAHTEIAYQPDSSMEAFNAKRLAKQGERRKARIFGVGA